MVCFPATASFSSDARTIASWSKIPDISAIIYVDTDNFVNIFTDFSTHFQIHLHIYRSKSKFLMFFFFYMYRSDYPYTNPPLVTELQPCMFQCAFCYVCFAERRDAYEWFCGLADPRHTQGHQSPDAQGENPHGGAVYEGGAGQKACSTGHPQTGQLQLPLFSQPESSTATFTAQHAGKLLLSCLLPGCWKTSMNCK